MNRLEKIYLAAFITFIVVATKATDEYIAVSLVGALVAAVLFVLVPPKESKD
jgi:hypothetical protein